MKYAESYLDTTVIGYEYSPEIFTGTELPFSVDVCEAVSERLAARGRPRDHPQPAGDGRDGHPERLRRPDRVVQPPADPAREHHHLAAPPQRPGYGGRGTELAMMAGADRVRGLPVRARRAHRQRRPGDAAMNLFSQGNDPQIDFSDIDEIRRTVEYCTQLPVHPGTPTPGPGLHGVQRLHPRTRSRRASRRSTYRPPRPAVRSASCRGRRPYLPIDPHDVVPAPTRP